MFHLGLLKYIKCDSLLQETDIYRKPEDDFWGTKLWSCSKSWLTFERLLHAQRKVFKDVACDIVETLRYDPRDNNQGRPTDNEAAEVLGDILEELEHCSRVVQDNLIKPTTNLLDMVCCSPSGY
jgi:hypothetical protein